MNDADELLGQRIGQFRIEATLGTGCMGKVWRAIDADRRQVALKLLQKGSSNFEENYARLRWEAKVLSHLSHPAIRRLIAFCEQEPWVYLALDYIPGISLADLVYEPTNEPTSPNLHGWKWILQRIDDLDKKWSQCSKIEKTSESLQRPAVGLPLAEPVAVELMERICRAVGYLHKNGVIHRDLKPGNILLRKDGSPVIVDFGLAKFRGCEDEQWWDADRIVGTPENMAPEQAEASEAVEEQADVYSLGTIFYLLLTGHRYFEATGNWAKDLERLRLHEGTKVRHWQPEVSQAVEEICLQALARDPQQRFQNAIEFASALANLVNRRSASVPNTSASEKQPSIPITKKELHLHNNRASQPQGRLQRRKTPMDQKTIAIAVGLGVFLLGIGLLSNLVIQPDSDRQGNESQQTDQLQKNNFTFSISELLEAPSADTDSNEGSEAIAWEVAEAEPEGEPTSEEEEKSQMSPELENQEELGEASFAADEYVLQVEQVADVDHRRAAMEIWRLVRAEGGRVEVGIENGGWSLQIEGSGQAELMALQQLPIRRLRVVRAEGFRVDWLAAEQLEELELLDCQLNLQGGIAQSFPNLEQLSLRGTRVSNLDWLGELPSLRTLDLGGTGLEDISGLSAPKLKKLDVSGTAMRSLLGISRFPLEEVIVDAKDMADARQRLLFLRYMPSVRRIGVGGEGKTMPAAEFWARRVGIRD